MAEKEAEKASAEDLHKEVNQLRSDLAAIVDTLKQMGADEGSRGPSGLG